MLKNWKRSLLLGLFLISILTIPSFSVNSLSGIPNNKKTLSCSLGPSAIYQISTLEDLQNMQNDLDGDYVLISDIDASETMNWNNGSGFTPIGNDTHSFNGTLDGNGYSIHDLYIFSTNSSIGLISTNTDHSRIFNTSLIDVNISGYWNVGGMVGINNGIIENCSVSGSVKGIYSNIGGIAGVNQQLSAGERKIQDCKTDVIISGMDYIGGIVGYSGSASILRCSSQGEVISSASFYGGGGGIAGGGSSLISQCWSNSTIYGDICLGGIIGNVRYGADIEDSYSDCEIICSDSTAGGIAGYMRRGSISNCYSISRVASNSSGGGLVGYIDLAQAFDSYWDKEASNVSTSALGIGKTTLEMKDIFLYRHWDMDGIWDMIDDVSYPFLRWSNLSVAKIDDMSDHYIDEDSCFYLDLEAVSELPGGHGVYWNFTTNVGDWLKLVGDDGISGTPGNDDVGAYWINLSATINHIFYDYRNFTLKVNNTNDAPIIRTTMLPASFEDIPYSYHLKAEDIDPTLDDLRWTMSANCDFLSIDEDSGELSGLPDEDDIGQHQINLNVTDGNGGYDEIELSLKVNNTNDDPVIITSEIENILEDEEFSIQLDGFDRDPTNDRFLWTLETSADFIEIGERSGILSGIPGNDDVGIWFLNINLSDGKGGSSEMSLTIEVLNVNDDPEILPVNISKYLEDQEIKIDLDAVDIDPTSDELTWSIDTDAGFLSISETNGMISGIPIQKDVGNWLINVTVSDGNGGADMISFNITIENVNDIPAALSDTITLEIEEDTRYSLDLGDIFTDPDDDELQYHHTLLDHIVISIQGKKIIFDPEENWVGSGNITITAEDGIGSATIWITIDILQINDPPHDVMISGRNRFDVSDPHIFYASAEDPDLGYGDRLIYTWTSNISGEIGIGESINISLPVGIHNITLTVRDSEGLGSSFSMEVVIFSTDRIGDVDSLNNDINWVTIIAISSFIFIIACAGFLLYALWGKKKNTWIKVHGPEEVETPIPYHKAPSIDQLPYQEDPIMMKSKSTGIVPYEEKDQ